MRAVYKTDDLQCPENLIPEISNQFGIDAARMLIMQIRHTSIVDQVKDDIDFVLNTKSDDEPHFVY